MEYSGRVFPTVWSFLMMALLLCLLCYVVGAFPTGLLIGRLHGINNIADHGSGNVGATNVSRVVGKRAGIYTLLGDVAKGALPLALLSLFDFTLQNLGCLGVFIVMGHCFSFPPKLKGGKGVATALGVFIGLSPILALLAIITFAAIFTASRIVSLSSVVTAALVPVYAMLIFPQYHAPLVPWLMIISAVVVYRHRENLGRLIQGTEKRFEFGKKE